MKSIRWLLLLLVLCKLSNSTTTGPMDTLAQFARRFWTTMASVAGEESRLKREEDETVKSSNIKTNRNSTLSDTKTRKTINKEVEVLGSVTTHHVDVTTTAPTVGVELQRPLPRKRNRTSTASTLATKRPSPRRPSSNSRPLAPIKVQPAEVNHSIKQPLRSTTCNETIASSSPTADTKDSEVFSISQFPHALSTRNQNRNQTKPKPISDSEVFSAITVSSSTLQGNNKTSLPLVNDSSSQEVASLIKAITTAMALVSEKLESNLDSVVTVYSEEERTEVPEKSLPLVEHVQPGINNVAKSSQSTVSDAQSPEFSRPSFLLVSRPDSDHHLELDDGLLTAEQVVQPLDDGKVTLKPTPPTRPPIKNETDEPGECFFEVADQEDMCDWNFTSLSSVKWSFGIGETAYMQGGPIKDSNGRIFGGYAFIDTSTGFAGNSAEIQRAELESPKLDKTSPNGRCLTFWYNIGGLSADRLRILLVAEDEFAQLKQSNQLSTYSVLWERKDTTNNTWVKGEILYTFSKPHRLIFEGFARSGTDHRRKFQGFIAVDDIAVDSDSCKAFCTFEGMLCEWENEEKSDDFDWKLGRGSLSHLTGPVRHHGDGLEGGYMYIDSSYPRRPGDIARLESRSIPATVDGPLCFKFWTHMYGNGVGTLRVIQKSDSDEKVIWEVTGESGNLWHLAQVTTASATEYKIVLEAIVGRNFLGNIAVDDIFFGPGPCPSSPQTALPSRGDCTFEADECGWINAGSGDQYDWIRTSPNQPILSAQGPNSGYKPSEPLSDHTTGLSSGFMLTMERSSVPPRAGDQAYIVGPVLQGSGQGRCFSFYTYMHERVIDTSGPGLGSLRVYLRVGSSSILKPIWRLINHEHPDWFFSQTPITTSEKFQIVIAGTWGNTRQGAISIDDFTFYDGNCSVVPAEAAVTPGECTFDSNMCEWTSVLDSNKELSTWQLSTSNRRPSNLIDHTYRANSGYVFFDIFSQHPHVVRLESPDLKLAAENSTNELTDDSSVERCLTFWFTPFGSSNRNTFLRVIQKDAESEQESVVWEITAATLQVFRPDWIYGQASVTNNATHKIIFEGSSNNGGFAVDDITFVPGGCESRPSNV